jgi:dethiobiotin synthetase
MTVAARKPAQSFDAGDDPTGFDAAVLGASTGEAAEEVCPRHRWYETAMAPPMAAEALGRPGFGIEQLVGETEWPSGGVDVGLVESAGGVRSPQADDGDAVVLCEALSPDVVLLVADAGLGTINAVRLAVGALGVISAGGAVGPGAGGAGGAVRPSVVVVLNRYEERNGLHVRNRQWLAERDGVSVMVTPGEEPRLVALLRGK